MRDVPSPFLGVVPDYSIEDGNMVISAGDWHLIMPLRVFERGLAKSQRVIAAHYAKKAEVVPMRRRKAD